MLPSDERARQVALRLADFLGGEGDRVPRVVGEERLRHGDADGGEQRHARRRPSRSAAPTSGWKLSNDPLPEKKPMATSSAMAPTLSTVNRFCTNAPASTPRQLTHVSSAMMATATSCARDSVKKPTLKMMSVLAEVQPDAAEELRERDRHRCVEAALDDEEHRPAVEEARRADRTLRAKTRTARRPSASSRTARRRRARRAASARHRRATARGRCRACR